MFCVPLKFLKGNFNNCCSPFYGNYSAYPAGYNPEFNYTQAQVGKSNQSINLLYKFIGL